MMFRRFFLGLVAVTAIGPTLCAAAPYAVYGVDRTDPWALPAPITGPSRGMFDVYDERPAIVAVPRRAAYAPVPLYERRVVVAPPAEAYVSPDAYAYAAPARSITRRGRTIIIRQ